MIETKSRVGAIIIQDNKLLLVKGKNHKEFWTPGGKMEPGETDEACLRRELKEELGVTVTKFTFYKAYLAKSFYHSYIIQSRIYIVSVHGRLKPGNEIKAYNWLGRDEFTKYPIIPSTLNLLIPDLIKDGYIT